uniref:CSON004358 protein n=1 Tax=Culicoides sonorensis TaxID=179676 RepID=A0A336LTM3_CULSO
MHLHTCLCGVLVYACVLRVCAKMNLTFRLFTFYNSTFPRNLRAKRFMINNQQIEFEKDYIASHTNAGNFLIGVCLAMIYIHFRKNRMDLSKYKSFVVLWHFTPVIAFLITSTVGFIFYHHDFELPSVWVSICSVFTRQTWGLLGIVLVLGFISKFRSPAKNFCNWPVFTPLSRLSYCIYLCHMTLARLLFGQEMLIANFSWLLFISQCLSLFVISNLFALMLCLCLEFPLTGLSRAVFRKQRAEFEEECKRIKEEQINATELTKL